MQVENQFRLLHKVALVAIRLGVIAVISYASLSIIFNLISPEKPGAYIHARISVAAAICTSANAVMIMILASICEGISSDSVRLWDKLDESDKTQRELEYYRKRAHDLADHLHSIGIVNLAKLEETKNHESTSDPS